MFDIDKIRDEFPFLNLKINEGSAVYLDNAASSQKPRTVIDRLSQVYEQEYANVHRGIHHLSMKATENFEDARNEIARFINSKILISKFLFRVKKNVHPCCCPAL